MTWYRKRLERLTGMSGYTKPPADDPLVKLDSNENFVIPRSVGIAAMSAAAAESDVREYPPSLDKLLTAISKYVKVTPHMIGVGNGSDQILDILLTNFATKKTRVLTSNPTFAFFEQRCTLYGIPMTRVDFTPDMKLDRGEFEKRFQKCQILYLDSPNNPTGFQFSGAELESMIQEFDGLVVIDEAYAEFGNSTVVPLVKKYDNLVVTRTFSKVFGMAGLRLGYIVSNPRMIDVFTRVLQHPYPVNTYAIRAGISALSDTRHMKKAVSVIRSERKRMIRDLRKYKNVFRVFDSAANFVLFDAGAADKRVFTALSEQGISVRRVGAVHGGAGRGGCLRVTVGTPEMNSKFLVAVRDLLG